MPNGFDQMQGFISGLMQQKYASDLRETLLNKELLARQEAAEQTNEWAKELIDLEEKSKERLADYELNKQREAQGEPIAYFDTITGKMSRDEIPNGIPLYADVDNNMGPAASLIRAIRGSEWGQNGLSLDDLGFAATDWPSTAMRKDVDLLGLTAEVENYATQIYIAGLQSGQPISKNDALEAAVQRIAVPSTVAQGLYPDAYHMKYVANPSEEGKNYFFELGGKTDLHLTEPEMFKFLSDANRLDMPVPLWLVQMLFHGATDEELRQVSDVFSDAYIEKLSDNSASDRGLNGTILESVLRETDPRYWASGPGFRFAPTER